MLVDSEAKENWLSQFSDVCAVIYLVALNEYDMLIEEDDTTNRMEESLKLFQKLSGSQWLRDTAMILFLNKSDLLKEKIQARPLRQCFEDFEEFENNYQYPPNSTGPLDSFDMGCEYIRAQYAQVFNGSRLYTFVTCALDTKNCEKVFFAVRDAIMARVFSKNF